MSKNSNIMRIKIWKCQLRQIVIEPNQNILYTYNKIKSLKNFSKQKRRYWRVSTVVTLLHAFNILSSQFKLLLVLLLTDSNLGFICIKIQISRKFSFEG